MSVYHVDPLRAEDAPETPEDPRPPVEPAQHTAEDEAFWDSQHEDQDDFEDFDNDEVDPWTMGDQYEADGYYDTLYNEVQALDRLTAGTLL